jgi:hypothetical protein
MDGKHESNATTQRAKATCRAGAEAASICPPHRTHQRPRFPRCRWIERKWLRFPSSSRLRMPPAADRSLEQAQAAPCRTQSYQMHGPCHATPAKLQSISGSWLGAMPYPRLRRGGRFPTALRPGNLARAFGRACGGYAANGVARLLASDPATWPLLEGTQVPEIAMNDIALLKLMICSCRSQACVSSRSCKRNLMSAELLFKRWTMYFRRHRFPMRTTDRSASAVS